MRKFLLGGAAALALALTGCGQSAEAPKVDVETFLSNAEAELQEYSDYANRIAWVNANFITDDTDWLSTWSGSAGTLLSVRLANEAKSYDGADLTPEQKRKLNILRSGITMPSPSAGTPEEQEKIAEELSGILTRIASTYGKGKFTITRVTPPPPSAYSTIASCTCVVTPLDQCLKKTTALNWFK